MIVGYPLGLRCMVSCMSEIILEFLAGDNSSVGRMGVRLQLLFFILRFWLLGTLVFPYGDFSLWDVLVDGSLHVQ